MDGRIEELVRQIHASPTRAVFYVAGGGLQVSLSQHTFSQGHSGTQAIRQLSPTYTSLSSLSSCSELAWKTELTVPGCAPSKALTWLLVVPGASNTVLESRVPYGGGKSMSEILGREPEKFASIQTAVDMARSAYRQAAHLSPFGTAILGVSCTCALATDRIKKGDHKVRLTAIVNTTFRSGLTNDMPVNSHSIHLILSMSHACCCQHGLLQLPPVHQSIENADAGVHSDP